MSQPEPVLTIAPDWSHVDSCAERLASAQAAVRLAQGVGLHAAVRELGTVRETILMELMAWMPERTAVQVRGSEYLFIAQGMAQVGFSFPPGYRRITRPGAALPMHSGIKRLGEQLPLSLKR